MRFGRTSKAVGVAAIAALALSACASTEGGGGDDPSDESSTAAAAGGSVSVAEVNAFSSFNADSATGNVDINGKVDYLTHWDFNYVDENLEIVQNEEFGSYEVLSEDPLSVKYTVNEGVTWSDGEAVDAGDLLLGWAILSGHFNDATLDEDGEVTSGADYFAYAGSTSGVGLTDLPEMGEDGRSITLNYSEPYADWEIAYGTSNIAAHVIAEQAGLADEDALIDVIMNAPEGDPENPEERPELKAMADAWNTGFDTKTLPSDPSLYLSNGPYIVDSMVAEQSMTLVRNEDFTWGPQPKLDEITIRYIGGAPAQVQALDNGDVDIMAPQASGDTLESLEALEGVNVITGDELAFDHIDLNYSGVFEDENVRKAFMHTIPRADIVNSTVKALNPNAEPRDSHIFVPGTEGYDAAVAVNGSDEYEEVDIELAKELLDGATPEVRIMYSVDNPNRVDAYTLIAESAEQAGFQVVDGGLPGSEWSGALGNGSYDATIFGWVSPGVGVTGVPQLYGSTSDSNFNGFASEEADALMDQLILETDPAVQQDLQVQIDTILFETGYGLPIFQSPSVNAGSDRVEGLVHNPGLYGIWWNFWDWSVTD